MPTPSEDLRLLRILKINSALIVVASLLSGCSTGQKPIVEAPPVVPATTVSQAQQTPTPAPAQTDEVQKAVERVFKDTVLIDSSHKPSYVVGDFNGDESPDVAVALKPVKEKLVELNADSPSWILRDPAGSSKELAGPRLRIADQEMLLAVIHGYGASGWRDAQATQTYLLKHVAGSPMKVQPLKEFMITNQGKTMPRFRGDIVAEVLNGKSGYLYYSGASYSWYDPTTYKAEPEQRMVHAPATAPTTK